VQALMDCASHVDKVLDDFAAATRKNNLDENLLVGNGMGGVWLILLFFLSSIAMLLLVSHLCLSYFLLHFRCQSHSTVLNS
jgi:hypothetical protein